MLDVIARLKRGEGSQSGSGISGYKCIPIYHPIIENLSISESKQHGNFEAHPFAAGESHALDLVRAGTALKRKGYDLGKRKEHPSDSIFGGTHIITPILHKEKQVGYIRHHQYPGGRTDLVSISCNADHFENFARIFFGPATKRLPPRRQKLLKGRQK